MERRKAVTVAAAASLTLLAGAAGIALNSGIVAGSTDGDVGKLSPLGAPSTSAVVEQPVPITVYVDEPATAAPGGTSAVRPTLAPPLVETTHRAPVTTSSASTVPEDEHEDEDEHEAEDEHEDEDDGGEDEHEEDEHEGAEDDD